MSFYQIFLGAIQVFMTLESTPVTMFRTDSVKYALIGLMRDLRGIAMATNRQVHIVYEFCLSMAFTIACIILLFIVFQSQNLWASF